MLLMILSAMASFGVVTAIDAGKGLMITSCFTARCNLYEYFVVASTHGIRDPEGTFIIWSYHSFTGA